MKKIANLLFVFLLFFNIMSLASCTVKEDQILENYPALKENHVYQEIKAATFLEKIENKETFVAIFSFPTCPWCQQLLPVLDECAKDAGIKTIDYIYLKEIRDNIEHPEHADYLKIYDYFKEYGAIDSAKERINAPTLVAIVDGEIKDYNLDTVPSHQMVNGTLPALNTEQIEDLKTILNNLLLLTK